MPDTYWDLFVGYAVFWLLFGFLGLRLMRSQAQLTRDLARLEESLGYKREVA